MVDSRSKRTGALVGGAVIALLAGISLLAAPDPQLAPGPPEAHHHAAGPADKDKADASSPAKKSAQNSCGICIERGPVQSSARYASWNDTDVKKAYDAAAKYPETMDLIHCFCECKESPRVHHKTLLTCFTNQHAAGCGVCQQEAILAAKLKGQGATDEEVEYTVESLHKTDGHPPTKGRGI
jgi:hypothetical protein